MSNPKKKEDESKFPKFSVRLDKGDDETPIQCISKEDTRASKTSDRIWQVASKISIYLSILIGATLIAHEIRIATIESNRFTNKDGNQLKEDMRDYMDKALKEDFADIKADQKEIIQRLRKVEDDVKEARFHLQTLSEG